MKTSTGARPLRVFLGEDSAILLERIKELLASIEGVQVVGDAQGAEQAISGVLETRPDAVVLDIRLAEGTGFDVLRALRERAPEVDFYMLSNFAFESFRQLAGQLGARDFFDKTNEIDRMREVIARRAAHLH